MPEIVIKADSPAATLEMLLSLARPHFAWKPDISTPAYGAAPIVTVHGVHPTELNGTFVVEGAKVEPQQTAGNITDEQLKDFALEAQAKATETQEPPKRRGRKPKAAEAPAEQSKITLAWPDGSTREYDTVGEALEAMADGLDLCTTVEEVNLFGARNQAVLDQATPDVQSALDDAAQERKAEIAKPLADAKAEAAAKVEDPLPKGDTIGAKKEPAKIPDLQHMRLLAVKYAMSTSKEDLMQVLGVARDGPDFKYVKGEPVPSLSTIPEDRRAWFVAKMREKVSIDEVPEE